MICHQEKYNAILIFIQGHFYLFSDFDSFLLQFSSLISFFLNENNTQEQQEKIL